MNNLCSFLMFIMHTQTQSPSLLLNRLQTVKELKVSLSLTAVLFPHIIPVSAAPFHTRD